MKSQVSVQPIYLPALSYLVESTDTWSSLYARFQQARRHAQGVAELGYVVLQYVRLWTHMGLWGLPARVHFQIMRNLVKLYLSHIIAPMQAAVTLILILVFIIPNLHWLLVEGAALEFVRDHVVSGEGLLTWACDAWSTLDKSQRGLFGSLMTILSWTPGNTVLLWFVLRGVTEGSYYSTLPKTKGKMMEPVKENGTKDGDAGGGANRA